jgi:hypothetical protein
MSHDPEPSAAVILPGLPASAGIAAEVKYFIAVSVLLALMQGAFVEISSVFGRVWPSAHSATIPLPPSHLPS